MKTYKALVSVMPRPEILDPQGKAVENAMNQLSSLRVDEVRIGKRIEFQIEAPDREAAEERVTELAKGLLANLIMEDYRIELTP